MPQADLVLEGGGVKGSGLVGAISALAAATEPYAFQRVAGTSAGAIVASFVAAGMSAADIKTTMDNLNFSQFEDEPKEFAHMPHIGGALGLLFHEGIFLGDFMHQWIAQTLASHGIRTWADLKQDDPGSSLPPEQRYKLVVIVSDVSRGLMLRLPWDYRELLGVDPDEQLVADAVRASASIPFFFRPFQMKTDPSIVRHSAIMCTDGGMLSNYPIDIFDRNDGQPARWPTLGVKLSARSNVSTSTWSPDADNLQLAKSLLSTMQDAHDRVYVADPAFASRTVFVDTTGYAATDFHLTAADKTKLFNNGLNSGERFLQGWNWDSWKRGDYNAILAATSTAVAPAVSG
ncbi:MAG: patatin-like phospholipase family protein [Microbacteriaceae bacterium]